MEQKQNKPVKSAGKKKKFTLYAVILTLLSLAVAIPVNLLASRLNITWDMTPASLYQLSDTTKEYLDSLDTTIDFYFLMDMDYLATDDDSMALYYTLQAYSKYDCINFVDFDPDANPEILEKINPEGLMKLSIGDIVITNGTNTKRVQADRMYWYDVSYDDSGNSVVEAAYFTGENPITGAIHSVVTGKESTVYFLSGHGEKTLENDYSLFRSDLENINYNAAELNLASVDSVPEDAEIILAAAPKFDISNDEARKIDAYLDEGGSIAFLMSPNADKTEYKNITRIMEDFGIGMDYDIVMETDPDLYMPDDPYTFLTSIVRTDSEEEDAVTITDEIVDMIDNKGYYPIFSNSRSFYQYIGSTDTSLRIGSLMQTVSSDTYETDLTATAVGKPYGGPDALAEDITGYPLDLAMYSTSTTRNNAKMIVFGNAEFIDDEHYEDPSAAVSLNLFLASMTWMYNSDLDLDMGIQNKAKDYDYMLLNSERTANSVLVTFFAVPVVIALAGVGVWLGRRYA